MSKAKAVCASCGGRLGARRVTIDRRIRGKLVEFDDVPANVCGDCGHAWLDGDVLEAMDASLLKPSRPRRVIRVPAISLAHLRAA